MINHNLFGYFDAIETVYQLTNCIKFEIQNVPECLPACSKPYQEVAPLSDMIAEGTLEFNLIIICLRNFEVLVERISVCNAIENLAEHGMHCLPCFYINNIINMLAKASN